jgi:hypothetical protein
MAVKHNLFGTTFVETLNITTVTQSVLLAMFLGVNLLFFHHTRMLKDPCSRLNASSSGASEQNAISLGPNTSGQQNPFLTTLTTVGRMRYKCQGFQVVQRYVIFLCEVMEMVNLTPWYQYRDPLVGVLDYIVEVRPPGYDRSF